MSEVSSGLGASTVDSRHHEQDLAGFPEVEQSRNSVTAHVADSVREEADVPAALVQSPSKFAARESSGEAQAIGTSVHPTSADMQTVSTCHCLPCLETFLLSCASSLLDSHATHPCVIPNLKEMSLKSLCVMYLEFVCCVLVNRCVNLLAYMCRWVEICLLATGLQPVHTGDCVSLKKCLIPVS